MKRAQGIVSDSDGKKHLIKENAMDYQGYTVKKPKESKNYKKVSENILKVINGMVNDAFDNGKKQIIINTNIESDFPLDNINKIAAPLIEAWAADVFSKVKENANNDYNLINVQVSTGRTDLADVILQFKKTDNYSTANVDVKSSADTIANSGKSPNITSFSKIRTAYIEDPDFVFVILSIRYHPYSEKKSDGLASCIIDLKDFKSYDFKFLAEEDFSINPALGSGQIQIRDIHYVETTYRTTCELLQLLDDKYLSSEKRTFDDWLKEAGKKKWIK